MKHLRRIGLVLLVAFGISSALFAQDPSVLLEKAIYTEETLGNLNDAIRMYQQVAAAADAGRATSALALFRLGMCYQKSGRADQAKAVFGKLAAQYPEQKDLLSQIPAASSDALALRPTPWVDGELLKMAIKVRSGQQAGTQFYRAESVQESGKAAWKMLLVQGSGSLSKYTSILVDASSLAPLISKTFNFAGEDYQALYTPLQVAYVTTRNGNSNKKQFSLDRATFDYEQLVYFLRCLPLREGFQITVPVSSASTASVQEMNIAVAGRESIAVAAGKFDCYKVTVGDSPQLIFWISADAHAYVVKETRSDLTVELASIETVEKTLPVRYEDSKYGVSLDTPPGWFVGGMTMQTEHVVGLIGPEGDADALLDYVEIREDGSAPSSLDEDVDKTIAQMQRLQADFAVRLESRRSTTVSGFQAIRYIADHKGFGPGTKIVEYVYQFKSPSKYFECRFKTSPENFDRLQPVFDSIMSSLKSQ
jgi:hypothetical protein